MDDEHEGADAGEVAGPGEAQQEDGGGVVDEHLPKVLALRVEELRDAERPVEGQLGHVVPPDGAVHRVHGVVVPAVADVPQPRLRPQARQAEAEDQRVVEPAPTGKKSEHFSWRKETTK